MHSLQTEGVIGRSRPCGVGSGTRTRLRRSALDRGDGILWHHRILMWRWTAVGGDASSRARLVVSCAIPDSCAEPALAGSAAMNPTRAASASFVPGWLVDWWVGLVVGGLVGCLDGMLDGLFVCLLVGWLGG